LEASEASLLSERQASELREQFIAVLGHDLRNPLASIAAGARMMTKVKSQEEMFEISGLMHSSIARMSLLIDNVLDFARGRLGGGLTLNRTTAEPIDRTLEQVIAEIRSSHLDATIETYFNVTEPIGYDSQRMSQCFQFCSEMRSRMDQPTDQSKCTPRLKIMNSNCRLSMRVIPFQTRC
jgi:signal transduction histidine kinase